MLGANIIIICENFKILNVFADYNGRETSIIEDSEAIVNAAYKKMSFTVPEVHSASPTELELPATAARLRLFHPTAVAEDFEPRIPHIHEVVLIDVPLVVIRPDAGAGRYGTVSQDRTNADSGTAEEKLIPYFTFEVSKEALTTIGGLDKTFFARAPDELHQGA